MPPTGSGSSPRGRENAGGRGALLGPPPLGGPPHPVRSSLPPAPSASAAHALPRRPLAGGPDVPPPPQRAAPAGISMQPVRRPRRP